MKDVSQTQKHLREALDSTKVSKSTIQSSAVASKAQANTSTAAAAKSKKRTTVNGDIDGKARSILYISINSINVIIYESISDHVSMLYIPFWLLPTAQQL
jgi:hypothetical protein